MKVHLVKAVVFPVVMHRCESWTVKKAEHWRIDAFELWCWRGLLRVPWTSRRSNQSILKEITPKYSLEGLMLKLKLQYFGHLMRRTDSLEKTLMLEKTEGRRRRDDKGWDGWMASPTQWTWVWINSGSWWWTGRPDVLQSMGSQRAEQNQATELNWTKQVFENRLLKWETWCSPSHVHWNWWPELYRDICNREAPRILEWVAIPFSRTYSWPRDWTQVSHIAGRFFFFFFFFLTSWATREAQECWSL